MSNARLLTILLALLGCAAPADRGEQTAPPVRVRVATPHRGDIATTIDVVGETAALDVVRLASPIAGRITALAVLPGDRLAPGTIVARVVPLESEAAARGLDLLASGTAPAAQEATTITRLRRQVLQREAVLRAPFAAVVSSRLHNPGEQVATGDVVAELFAPRSLHVVAQIPLDAIGRIRPGNRVEVDGETLRGTGSIAAVVPALTPVAVSVPVRVTLDRIPEQAILGAPVHCRITVRRRRGALLVPRSAVVSPRERGHHAELMVADGGAVAHRSVRLGLRGATEVEVRGGVTGDDRVLVDGQYALPDGTPIEPLEAAAEP